MASQERAPVKTYVSPDEKAQWRAHADELEMSLAEYVRTMINAGKRNFDLEPVETLPSGSNPRGQSLETRVLQAVGEEYRSWADLETRFDDVDPDRLSEVLQDLQADNRIEHDGRHGGYTRLDDE